MIQSVSLSLSISFNAARGFVGGAAPRRSTSLPRRICFNAARGFVGGAAYQRVWNIFISRCFNAARGFVGGAAPCLEALHARDLVSMPHAALWVVQLRRSQPFSP